MKKDSPIFVAGEGTMEGKAIIRLLQKRNYNKVINLKQPEPDLTDHVKVKEYFEEIHPQYVFLFAGKSGGIKANQENPATLMLDNWQIISNVISLAHEYKIEKLLYLASSCIYPKHSEQPMRPDMLMTGPLEPTNSAYATAKLAGIELCRAYQREHKNNFISAIPANIFGPEDDFNKENSHVVAALIRKMDEAKRNGNNTIDIWGTGKPRREFIFMDDLADACLFLMDHYSDYDPINIGSGMSFSISDLARVISDVTEYRGNLRYDDSLPDGMPEKMLDCEPLFSLGWEPSIKFELGAKITYDWFKLNYDHTSPMKN